MLANDLDARMGRRLREMRERAGLDLDALAGRTGLQPATLGQYEAGRSRIPVDALALLARRLERPVADFFA